MNNIVANVMSFNVRLDMWGEPVKWSERKEVVAHVIETHLPDIIGTQEATTVMLEWLKDRLSDNYIVYGQKRSEIPGEDEHSAIFVKKNKFKIIKQNSFMLSETPDVIGRKGWDSACPRVCSWVELALIDSDVPFVRMFNTHLDHQGEIARTEGIKLIAQKIKECNEEKKLPTIITGDFNTEPDNVIFNPIHSTNEFSWWYDLLTEEDKENALTYHDYFGHIKGNPIDYIFYTKDIEMLNVQIIRDKKDGVYPSDHYPIIGTIKL